MLPILTYNKIDMKSTLASILAPLCIFAMAILCPQQAVADVFQHSWQGKMGPGISFQINFEESTFGTLIGETTYFRKNGKVSVIHCYGMRIGDEDDDEISYFLTEYVGTKVCGYITLSLKGGRLEHGSWSLLDKVYEMYDMEEPDYIPFFDYFMPVGGPNDAAGEYSFTYATGNPSFPESGGHCTITMKGPDTIHWEMSQVTPNIAEASGDSKMTGPYFEGRHGDFTFEAYVDKQIIYVKDTSPANIETDDWGAWATIEGVYVRK